MMITAHSEHGKVGEVGMKEFIIEVDHPYTQGMQELVRCKDCKWRENTGASTKWLPCMEIKTNGNWFCADGERR